MFLDYGPEGGSGFHVYGLPAHEYPGLLKLVLHDGDHVTVADLPRVPDQTLCTRVGPCRLRP